MTTFRFNLAFCLMSVLAQRGITQTTITNNEVAESKYGFFEEMIRHLFKMGKDNIDQNTAFWETFTKNYNKTVSGILHSNFDLQDELSKLQKDVKELIAVSNSTELFFIKAIALAKQASAISGDGLQIFNSLSAIVTDFTTGMRTAVLLLLNALGRNFDNLEAMVKYPPTAIYLKIVQVYRGVTKQLSALLSAVSKEVTKLGSSIATDMNIARGVIAEINKTLTAAAGRIVPVLQNVIQGVEHVIADMTTLPRWTAAALGVFISRLDNVVQTEVQVIASIAEAITAPIRNVINGIRQVGHTVVHGIGSVVGGVVKTAIGVPLGIIARG